MNLPLTVGRHSNISGATESRAFAKNARPREALSGRLLARLLKDRFISPGNILRTYS
jgi:hypothetical protein